MLGTVSGSKVTKDRESDAFTASSAGAAKESAAANEASLAGVEAFVQDFDAGVNANDAVMQNKNNTTPTSA